MKKFIVGILVGILFIAGVEGLVAQTNVQTLRNVTFSVANPTLYFDGIIRFAHRTGSANKSILTPTLSPSTMAAQNSNAIGLVEQSFTVTGLTTIDRVFVNGPAPTALCGPANYRVSAANTLTVAFAQFTSVACTPATGTYYITVIRGVG